MLPTKPIGRTCARRCARALFDQLDEIVVVVVGGGDLAVAVDPRTTGSRGARKRLFGEANESAILLSWPSRSSKRLVVAVEMATQRTVRSGRATADR